MRCLSYSTSSGTPSFLSCILSSHQTFSPPPPFSSFSTYDDNDDYDSNSRSFSS